MRSLSGQKFDREPLGVTWIHGSPPAEHTADPPVQAHWHDEHTVLLRQNKAIHYEAPFFYLLFGARRAVLIELTDTTTKSAVPIVAVTIEAGDPDMGRWPAAGACPRDLLVADS